MHVRHPVDKAVKRGGGEIFNESRRLILCADHVDDLIAFLEPVENLLYALQRVLQVRVHADHAVAPGIVDACDHGRLVAEIPGEVDDLHQRILPRQASQYVKGAVLAPVIYKNQLVVPA